ncbi:SET domain-containing protein-lysine N-methyltransferase, partial [bacterium]|nr:SET domain-containing protein-lysine N-methyltransferase [bacterium]
MLSYLNPDVEIRFISTQKGYGLVAKKNLPAMFLVGIDFSINTQYSLAFPNSVPRDVRKHMNGSNFLIKYFTGTPSENRTFEQFEKKNRKKTNVHEIQNYKQHYGNYTFHYKVLPLFQILNHCKIPNVHMFSTGDSNNLFMCFTVRPVKKDEELCFSYLNRISPSRPDISEQQHQPFLLEMDRMNTRPENERPDYLKKIHNLESRRIPHDIVEWYQDNISLFLEKYRDSSISDTETMMALHQIACAVLVYTY